MLWTGPWYAAKHLGMPHCMLKQPGPVPHSDFLIWEYVNFAEHLKHLFLSLGSRLLEEPPLPHFPLVTPHFQFIPILLPQRSPRKPLFLSLLEEVQPPFCFGFQSLFICSQSSIPKNVPFCSSALCCLPL